MPTLIEAPLYTGADRRLYAADMPRRVILGVQDFRKRLKERLDALARGEETIVMRRGKFVAALVTPDSYREQRERSGEPTDL